MGDLILKVANLDEFLRAFAGSKVCIGYVCMVYSHKTKEYLVYVDNPEDARLPELLYTGDNFETAFNFLKPEGG